MEEVVDYSHYFQNLTTEFENTNTLLNQIIEQNNDIITSITFNSYTQLFIVGVILAIALVHILKGMI